LEDSIGNVEGFIAQLSPADSRGAARLLADTKRGRVHGLRQFSALTSFVCYGFGVPPARHAFLIPHESSFFSNSMGAYLVFCEGLLNLVAAHLGKRSLEALERRERLITALGIESS